MRGEPPKDTAICAPRCGTEYGNPCENFCPAHVYEIIDDGANPPLGRPIEETVQRPRQVQWEGAPVAPVEGWTDALVGRAGAALRIIASYAIGRPATQTRGYASDVHGGQIALSQGLMAGAFQPDELFSSSKDTLAP